MSNRTHTAITPTTVATLVAVAALGLGAASCSATPSQDASPSSSSSSSVTVTVASASDTTPDTAPAGSASSGADPGSTGSAGSGGDCTVNGEVRGDDTARYIERPATVSLTNAGAGVPPAFYSSEQSAMALFLYAEGAAPANVIWTTIATTGTETTYTSSPSSTGLVIEADGSGATVTTTLESADGKTVEMDIAVVC